MCQNYKSETWCIYGRKCFFRHVEAEAKFSKESKKGGAKGSAALFVYLKILIRETLLYTWKGEIGIKTRRQILQGHVAPTKKSGRKGSIARYYPKVCASWAQSLRAKFRRRITWGDLAPRKMRPQSSMGFGENIHKLKNGTKLRFIFLLKQR